MTRRRVKPNPPIPGHELLDEGQAYRTYGPDENYNGWRVGCRCGQRPPDWTPDMSLSAVKRWHREHKAQLRGQR